MTQDFNKLPPSNNRSNRKKMYTALLVGACLGLLLLLALLFYWIKPKADNATVLPADTITPLSAPTAASTPIATTASTPSMTLTPAKLPPLPHSLQGTKVDGEIIIDDSKNLVVTKGLRRLFDYFLSAQGEESLETIDLRVVDYIRSHTPEPAASQAVDIYHHYTQYLTQVATLEKQFAPPAPKADTPLPTLDLNLITKRQTALTALQKNLFDDKTIQAFFGEQLALDNYTMAAMQASNNANLTESQKAAAIQAAKAQYLNSFGDPELKTQLEQQANVEKLLEETQKMQAQGASQADLDAMRRKYVDEKAVQRLDKLDQETQNFDSKFTAYQQQRDAILASQGNNPQAQKAIEQLQKQTFSEQDIKRLSGYEAVKKAQTQAVANK